MKQLALLLVMLVATGGCSDDPSRARTSPPPPALKIEHARFPVSLGGETIQVARSDRTGPNLGITPDVGEIADVAWVADTSILRFAMWNPGGRWSVYQFQAAQLDSYNPKNPPLRAQLQSSAEADRDGGSRLSPDGRTQALVRDGKLYLQELDDDPREVATEGAVSNVTWSPHGERLAFRAGEAERSRWFIVEADGSGLREIGPSSLRRMSLVGWSPDAQRLAFQFFPLIYETPISVYVASIDGGQAVKVGEYAWPPGHDGGPPQTPRWSLDGERILVFGDVMYAVDASGAVPAQPIASADIDAEFGPQEVGRAFIFSPDRTYFASVYTGTYRSVWKVDVASGRVNSVPSDPTLVVGEDHADRITELDVHVAPNDLYVAIGLGTQLLISQGLGGGQTRVIETGVPQRVDLRWSPDGLHLLYSDGVTYYVVSAFDDAAPHQIGSKADGTMAIWSDDSQRIALAHGIDAMDITIVGLDGGREHIADAGDLLKNGWDLPEFFERPRVFASESVKHRGDFDVYIADADGGNRRQLTDSPGTEQEPALSPDGETIVFIRNDRELWLMGADGDNQRLLSSDFKSVGVPQPLTWSPDGRFIVWSRFGELKIVEVATGDTFAPASAGAGCYIYFVAWTPDSREIYLRTHCAFDGL